MEGNSIFTTQNGNIYVDFDVQNLIVVDPNKIVDQDNKIHERLVQHENLVMYANLETKLLPRTRLAVGTTVQTEISTISIAEINFLRPGNQDFLSNDYTNLLTGEGALNKGSTNKTAETIPPPNALKPQASIGPGKSRQTDLSTGLLGITQINCKINTSFVPQVTIELEDIQGRALFEKGDESPYAAFFHLPYPPFFLTLKGFYGKAIRYQLNLISFNARFNTSSGNYQVTLQFYGYKFNILNEISLGTLFAVPHMYATQYQISQGVPNSNNRTTSTITTEGGMVKIKEVYQDYKSKGILPKDFPELSVPELLNRLELFEQNIQNSWTKAEVASLTEQRNYLFNLNLYQGEVYSNPTSWFNTNCDKTKAIVLKTGEVLFPLSKPVKEGTTNTGAKTEQGADAKLKSLITEYNTKLRENSVFGDNGKLPIKVDITYDNFIIAVDINNIDVVKTYRLRNKSNQELKGADLESYRASLGLELGIQTINQAITEKQNNSELNLYVFEGSKRFVGLINKLKEELNRKALQEEERLTAILAQKLESRSEGIGFKPSIKNVIAVIMASTEAFVRLLDDVHRNAWNKRDDPVRRRSILRFPSSDTKGDVQIENKENLTPIYPWPQFFIESEQEGQKYVPAYPGDISVVDLTQGYDYTTWPEVEFVEEFFKGYVEREQLTKEISEKEDESEVIDRLTLNSLEFPQTNIPYFNKEETKFFFEIWERTYLNSHYNRFQRGGNVKEIYETIGKNEAQNIIDALGSSAPYLVPKLKNYGFTFNNFLGVLAHISSQGQGPSIQKLIRDIFATPYIQAYVEIPFEIFDQSVVDLDAPSIDRNLDQTDLRNFQSLINANVQPDFCDTYPFTNRAWLQTSVESSAKALAGLFYNTKRTLFVNTTKKVIANFEPTTSNETIRPVTSFCYYNDALPDIPQKNVNLYYSTIVDASLMYSTEGYCSGLNQGTETRQTTSIMNTPYFVNALQNGVQNWIANEKHPFVQGAYLLLNSLPLSTLRGTYKTKDEVEPLDYIAASLKRFGSVHKLPYAWILKLGSIYHRYKRYVNEGIDILDTCWKDFDYVKNFDPVGASPNKTYNLNFGNGVSEVYLQRSTSAFFPGSLVPTTFHSIQGGFYPKLINDMNYFLNGKICFSTYSDLEIQIFVDSNMRVSNIESGNINKNYFSSITPSVLSMRSWSVMINNDSGDSIYTTPSFGSTIPNQTFSSVIDSSSGTNFLVGDVTDNPAIFNGTVRSFWAASNWGYFDTTRNVKPTPEQYMTFVNPQASIPEAFGLYEAPIYSSIEDIFSVFSKDELELMESKFLDFSLPVYSIKTDVGPGERKTTINVDVNDSDRALKNFQLMVREFFEIGVPLPDLSNQDYFDTAVVNQFNNITSILRRFMEYNVVVKIGNPSQYNRRLFDSFLPDYNTGYEFTSRQGEQSNQVAFILRDPVTFDPYVVGSLPSRGGNVTLAQSETNSPEAWKELRLQLGPSTILGMNYSSQGSYVTDFFIDNNMAFTQLNVKNWAPLIRIYATQKLKNNNLTSSEFKNLLKNYSDEMISYQQQVFTSLFQILQKDLPDYNYTPPGVIKSALEGKITKEQAYETFKAINDKWIAGNAYNEETLLQDFLFVDRASRNVGDSIFIDIFSLKNQLKRLDLNAKIYTLIGGILIQNNFTMMPIPGYVNFYNIQTPDGTSTPRGETSADFANSLWGTFLSVDYRKSQPKMVCFYAEKPSNYPDLGRNKDFRYKNDGFNCNSLTSNPLLENQKDKVDWSQSNRCVAFNVDMGIRNQNVFYSFSVSQDIGAATMESLIQTNNLANQSSGKDVASQNVSLLNIYNERSYSCSVVSLGNALIQPTMYFCLNHVPMFNGAYMILEVTHQITPGNFQTSFTGVRQRLFDSVRPNNYLMSLNKDLLQKLPDRLKQPQSTTPGGQIVETSDKTNAGENSCQDLLNTIYRKTYSVENAKSTQVPLQNFATSIKNNGLLSDITDEKQRTQLAIMIYVISFVGSEKKGTLQSFGNNYSNVSLEDQWKNSDKFFEKTFCCVNTATSTNKDNTKDKQDSKPFANFKDVDTFVKFMAERLRTPISTSLTTKSTNSYVPTFESAYNFYVSFWPQVKNTETEKEDFKVNQGTSFETKIRSALSSVESVFPVAGIKLFSDANPIKEVQGQKVNTNVTSNADDATKFQNAKLGVDTRFFVNASTTSDIKITVSGGISDIPSKEYTLDIFLLSNRGMGTGEIKLGRTKLVDGKYKLTTDKSFEDALIIAPDNDGLIYFKVLVVEFNISYTNTYAVMNIDCPGNNYKRYDLISPSEYKIIVNDFCNECYPNGTNGKRIEYNGKNCSGVPDVGDVFDVRTTKTGDRITEVSFSIKANVGSWSINKSSVIYECQSAGSKTSTVSGSISNNGQEITFDINKILTDGCGRGEYKMTIEVMAIPTLPNGQRDTARERKTTSYPLSGIF